MIIYQEQELLKRLASGEQEAFAQVFREYYSALCVFAQRIMVTPGDAVQVEDVVNGVFGRLWEKRPVFNDVGHVRAFLYAATRNACYDAIKVQARRMERQGVFAQAQEEEDRERSVELDMITTEVYRQIYQEIAQLPGNCGTIIRMGYLEGQTNEEIAQALGLSVQTVKNQKSRGIGMLRSRLSPDLLLVFLLLARL